MSEEEVIISIKSCINSVKGGVLLSRINRDYRELMGEDIPYFKLGYSSLKSFIRSISDIRITNTASEGEVLTCCGGKAAHIASLVSRQATAKASKKKLGKVISLPRRFRESSVQPSRTPSRNGSLTRENKFVETSEQIHPKHLKSGYQDNVGKRSLPPRLQRARIAARGTDPRYISEPSTDDFISTTNASNMNGSDRLEEEKGSSNVSNTRPAAFGKEHRKSRVLHSQKFMKSIVDEGSAESNNKWAQRSVSSSITSETVDQKSRLLRGPSACANLKVYDDLEAFHNIQSGKSTSAKTLTITVSDNKRNVMLHTDSMLSSSQESKVPIYDDRFHEFDNYDRRVLRVSEEQERLRTLASTNVSCDVQGVYPEDWYDPESSCLVGQVASQRHSNMYPGVGRLSSASSINKFSASDATSIGSLTQDFSHLEVSEPGLTIVQPTLFHHLLIGDDFLLNLAVKYMKFKGCKVGNRTISCGLCCSGQNIKSCLYQLKQSKLQISKVMLLIGAVDILEGSAIDTMKCHMTMLVNYLCSNVKTLLVLTVPPLPLTDDPASWQKLLEFNRWLIEFIGREYLNIHVFDLWLLFENPPGIICEEMFEDDSEPMYKHREEVLLFSEQGRRELINFLRDSVLSLPNSHRRA